MKKIDRETVQRILDTADIVDVVSDFVNLKRRGANYMGLCPFHNERTPSFSVSKSKNICKCFSCGKGGSPLNFIMELEQLSYNEALRYLAKKYNIEIKEHEMTDHEREMESERESLFAINDFAMRFFDNTLVNNEEGRSIGLSYFYERGINEASIKKFHLGYSPERSDALYQAAIQKGYTEEKLLKTGLCGRSESGRVYDRFRGRVIYPVFTVSGKVVAFGGRTLRKEDKAKYVNSPESDIYSKSRELYGLYQAKRAIGKTDKCYLVEGYMDVISMSQAGIENVVASSGTSLTDGQIKMIHRFTENVTLMYDGDAAGIKAALRGSDMLLAEGLSLKVVLLPPGEDPDSYAQSHSSSEIEEYIRTHESDFIQFMIDVKLSDCGNDVLARAKVITDVIASIATIPNPVARDLYVQECARRFGVDTRMVSRQVTRKMAEQAEKNSKRERKEIAAETIKDIEQPAADTRSSQEVIAEINNDAARLRPHELAILKYVLRYGLVNIGDDYDEEGNATPYDVIDYVLSELQTDDLTFTNPDIRLTLDEAVMEKGNWLSYLPEVEKRLDSRRREEIAEAERELQMSGADLSTIKRREREITDTADANYAAGMLREQMLFLSKRLSSHPDATIRELTLELVSEKHVLSKVHTKYMKIEAEHERLPDLMPRVIYEYKDAILSCRIRDLQGQIKAEGSRQPYDPVRITSLMEQLANLHQIRSDFARYLGERIVYPRK